jgi:sarcosine oxidase
VERVDVAVVGAGIAGSAIARACARRGLDVALIDQFEFGHDRGSSHGGVRIFRFAYPDPFYVLLAQRALPLWRELESERGSTLIELVGGVDHGDEHAVRAVHDALVAAGAHAELLRPDAAAERFPGLRFEGIVCESRDTGRVRAARAWTDLIASAAAHGVRLHPTTPVEAVEVQDARARVVTSDGGFDATTVVVAAGAWVGDLASPHVELPSLEISQEHVFHFAPRAGAPSEWPSFIHYREPAAAYGMLTPGEGVKVGEHHAGAAIDHPSARLTSLDPARRDAVLRYVEHWVPGVEPLPVSETTCLYTTTPDEDFVLDRHGPIVVASPCSGHGFKFAPLIGELAADLVQGLASSLDRFRLPR